MHKDTQNLFETLRKKRNELARRFNIKPFMVFHNKVLAEIAKKKPTTLKQLTQIKGLGSKKIAKYGSFVLDVLSDFSPTVTSKAYAEKIFSVSEYIDFLNQILALKRAIVQGEIGRIDDRGKYTFFTLLDKDEEAILNCFIWKSQLDNFSIRLKEGLEIKIEGFPKVFKRRGSFTFEVERIGLVGEGVLKLAFEALKKKLATAGFFAPEGKKQIPQFVEKIGLITSSFADAKNDFLTHLGNFGFKIHFYDVRVEGLYAIEDITSAIKYFNENMTDVEVLVLTRGGGSFESLQAFNSETLAKAIFASRIPIITGIGHENDETIADLVTDVYSSTPTAAARVLSDPWRKADLLLSQYQQSLTSTFFSHYDKIKNNLLFLERFFASLMNRYQIRIKDLTSSLWQEGVQWFKFLQSKVVQEEQRLNLADPTFRLKQGYSIAFNKARKVIKSTKQIKIGEILNLRFYQGRASSRVEKINL